MDTANTRVDEWLSWPLDHTTRNAIIELQQKDPQGLAERFSSSLAFGTGGMRALMGVGTNRLNLYTVGFATQGLANYLLERHGRKEPISVFISYDSRHHSRSFAEQSAKVLAGSGIRVYLTKDLRPTPFVSFGVRHLQCDAGIMITASHNTKEYNGYKVYWSDGSQVLPPHDGAIVEHVHKLSKWSEVSLSELHSPLITIVSTELDEAYYAALEPLRRFDHLNLADKKNLRVIYTSLHGVGITLLPSALHRFGFEKPLLTPHQCVLDGNFPTVKSPNPEERQALSLGIETLEKERGDILIATDPDADRMAVVCMHQQTPHPLTGNQIAVICLHYLCEATKQDTTTKGAITTIVSTDLFAQICRKYHVRDYAFLTGFKYIGQQMHTWEMQTPSPCEFLFGAEESYGFLIGNHSHDKDATAASYLICLIGATLKKRGKTLIDYLEQIYREFGFFFEKQHVIAFAPGDAGLKKMSSILESLRKESPKAFAGIEIESVCDYLSSVATHYDTHQKTALDLPSSDVLLFRLKDHSKIVIRPSGTEPKLKIYLGLYDPKFVSIKDNEEKALTRYQALVDALIALFK